MTSGVVWWSANLQYPNWITVREGRPGYLSLGDVHFQNTLKLSVILWGSSESTLTNCNSIRILKICTPPDNSRGHPSRPLQSQLQFGYFVVAPTTQQSDGLFSGAAQVSSPPTYEGRPSRPHRFYSTSGISVLHLNNQHPRAVQVDRSSSKQPTSFRLSSMGKFLIKYNWKWQ